MGHLGQRWRAETMKPCNGARWPAGASTGPRPSSRVPLAWDPPLVGPLAAPAGAWAAPWRWPWPDGGPCPQARRLPVLAGPGGRRGSHHGGEAAGDGVRAGS